MLQMIVHEVSGTRPASCLCAGYEMKEWRAEALADFLMESLPDFCLTYSEYRRIDHASAIRLIRQAAQAVYRTEKFQKRGEFGELMLHVILKMTMNTLPVVSKIYYKDGANETVKGFDAVHVVPGDGGLELWLGEVKFYSDISRAIADVSIELEKHLKADYLRSEFVAIVNKIDPDWPHASALSTLLDPRTSLDQVFNAFCIPVLLTYDGDATNKHDALTDDYRQELASEVAEIRKKFEGKVGSIPHRIHLFLVPLKTKQHFVEVLDHKLKVLQEL